MVHLICSFLARFCTPFMLCGVWSQAIFEYSATHQLIDDEAIQDEDAGHMRALTFPTFLEAVVRFAFERANPKWSRDTTGRLNAGFPAYLIPVPHCLERFLHNCVLRFAPRDDVWRFCKSLLRDKQTQKVQAGSLFRGFCAWITEFIAF
jgi:hypothetical protein